MSERLQSDPATIRAAMGERNGIYENLDEAEYHSHPALSSTGARRLLESPAKFQYERTHPRAGRTAFDLGTAVHTKVLGTGASAIAYPDEHLTPSGNVSTKAATVEWAEEQRGLGLTPLAPAQMREVDAMAEAVLGHDDARSFLESVSGREVSLFAEIDGVPTRARFDIYDGVRAGDLKTARDASPKGFNTAVGRLGYFIQDRWYGEAHTAITGTELESFRFLVVENVAPYLVGVYDLDFMWEDLAKERVKRARDLWRECTETGVWPGYPSATLTPPTWAVFDADRDEQEIQV
jgi:hypothetical protein